MMRLKLQSTLPEPIEIEWPDGSIKTLTRKVINSKNVDEFDRVNKDLSELHAKNEINGLEYTIETILHIASGIDRADLEELDVSQLMLIANELQALVENMASPKKNGLDSGITKSESAGPPVLVQANTTS